MIAAGEFNRRIQIQAPSSDRDSFGQPTQSRDIVYTCWASIGIQASQLIYATAEFVSKATHRIEMRWTSSVIISQNQRVVYTEPTTGVGHIYEIQAVLNDKQDNTKLILMCYELNGSE